MCFTYWKFSFAGLLINKYAFLIDNKKKNVLKKKRYFLPIGAIGNFGNATISYNQIWHFELGLFDITFREQIFLNMRSVQIYNETTQVYKKYI